MFNQCCCFFGRSEPMRETLLAAQQTFQYDGINYQISRSYEFEKTRYFNSFLYKNPLTENIYGGWKIHISLDPTNIHNIAIAWADVILPELVSCGIREFKIAREESIPMIVDEAIGQGKLITVYLRHNPELGSNRPNHRNLINTLTRIEDRLIRAGIQPGQKPIIDRAIQGSQYMSFRCDTLLPDLGTQERIEGIVYALSDDDALAIASEARTQTYNPFDMQDEYGLYDLIIKPQPIYTFNSI